MESDSDVWCNGQKKKVLAKKCNYNCILPDVFLALKMNQ
jgi:hypothetical protein